MDRYYSMSLLLLVMALMPNVYSWSAVPATTRSINGHQRNEVSPYLDLVLCPIRAEPWSCARQQSGRILDIWDNELHSQWQKLKVEADQQLNATLERRGYSASELVIKEKPSTILKKIEIGTNYMKEYLSESLDGFLGREYDYGQSFKVHNDIQNDQAPSENDEVDDTDNDDEAGDGDDDDDEDETDNDNDDEEDEGDSKNTAIINDNTSNGNEFIEIESHDNGDQHTTDELKDANDRFKRKKGNRNKNKKKGSQHDIASQAANLLVIQPLEHQLAEAEHHVQEVVHKVKPAKRKGKPLKDKRRKRKKGDDVTTVVVEQEPSSDHLSLGLLDALSDFDVLEEGGKRKKRPLKYGRSIGVTRGKKKKKKKAIQKFILLGSFLKAKIELLLKILGAHLQIKFFAIALIGLLINIARFWIDVKRGGVPQKVVYVEHAHHQHHYEDHGEDWSESGGGYWKRSLQTDNPVDEYDSTTDSYQPRPVEPQQAYDAQYMAYRNQWQRK